ncbi:lysozyme [Enterococcus sp. AZ189]|uniref:lysozyme n=1 Tax=Enterococcus sp. AZ189 TaxID=2774871 RepID=UPI003F23BA68
MARTIGEVKNFLDGLVGQITVDKSDASLNGQCVSLIKNLLEFLGAPNPYGARGNASDIPNTYVSQGIARSGSGTLTIAVNRQIADGFGHVWVKIGSDSWQANYAGKAVKKNVNEVAITDLLNLNQWITGSNDSNSGVKATTLGSKGEALIKEFESCRLTAYDLGDGMITIGWGHAEPKGRTNLVAGVTTWSQAQADSQFWKDMPSYVNAVNNYFTRSFNQNQFDAMVSFTYNVGTGAFGNDGWDKNASNSYITESMANYINRGTEYEAGLRRRRQAEINLFNTPVSNGETTNKGGETTMQCIYWKPSKVGGGANIAYYFNGANCKLISHADSTKILKQIYKANNGKDMPEYAWTYDAPWFSRLEAVAPII